MTKRLLIFFFILLAVSSCTVQKRLHSTGFHVEFRKKLQKPDSHELNTIQVRSETQETEPASIYTEVITDTLLIPEKVEEGVYPTKITEISTSSQSVAGESELKPTSKRFLTNIAIQTHFSESLLNKSFKKNKIKQRRSKSSDFDWDEFWEWMLIVGIILGSALVLSLVVPGVNFLQALLVVLLGILALYLFVLLISLAFGNFRFEWFWSGR